MKKRVMLLGGSMIVIVMMGLFLFHVTGKADEEKIYIPNLSVRNSVVGAIDDEVIDQLPSKEQMLEIRDTLIIQERDYDNPSRSLEGLEEAKNVSSLHLLMLNEILDYRPIGGMSKLEDLMIYSDSYNSDTLSKNTIDIAFISELKHLKNFNAGMAVLDLTPLSKLEKLENVEISGRLKNGTPLLVSKQTKDLAIKNPVIYSKQFVEENSAVEVFDSEGNIIPVTISGNHFFVKDIPEETKEITFEISNNSTIFANASHSIVYTCKVDWY